MDSSRAAFLLLLTEVAVAGVASAQSSVAGGVAGRVRDGLGLPMTGVAVSVSSGALIGGRLMTTTDSRGGYRFLSLPVGIYDLDATLNGFRSVRNEGLRVEAGRMLGVDLVLEPSLVSEEITVTAKAPLVSVLDNRLATSFDTRFTKNQALKRSYYNLFKDAPGVNLDHRSVANVVLAYGGTTESQNAFTLDGINVANTAFGGQWVQPSMQFMEEIQIGGLGANAEFGGYTGGVINGVTKSGGDQANGSIEIHHQPSSWVSDNDPDSDEEEFALDDYAASAGGPVVGDRLWYFLSGEYIDQVTTPFGAIASTDRGVLRALGKLTLQANPAHRLALVAEYDSISSERLFIGRLTLPEASSRQEWRGAFTSLSWESQVDEANLAVLRLSGNAGRNDYLPYHGFDTPGRVDVATGLAWVNQEIRQLNDRKLAAAGGSWSLLKSGLFRDADSHAFKFGGTYEQGSSTDEWLRNGGFTYSDNSSACGSVAAYFADPSCGNYFVERGGGEFDSHPEYEGFAIYAQDSLRLDRVTVNAGLRFGDYDGGWQAGHGAPNVFSAAYLDPRIGLVWDLRGDARTALKAHWGRYHDKIYTYLFDREASGEAALPDATCFWNEASQSFDLCGAPGAQRARMGETALAYVDESLLSIEQQLGTDVLLGVDLLDRRFRDIMAMVNANEDYDLLTAPNPVTGGTLPVWDLRSQPDWVLTTVDSAYRDFRSATVRLDKRHRDGWSARASVVYSDFEGNILQNNGYAREFSDRNGLYNTDGRMGYAFNEWEVKLAGAVELPLGFGLSSQYRYLSGWFWAPYGRFAGLAYNQIAGQDINLLPRGTEELPSRQVLDLRASWSGKVGGRLRVTLTVDVFNVFNSDTTLNLQNRWGLYRIATGAWLQRQDYGATTQIETPREIRAGLRLEF